MSTRIKIFKQLGKNVKRPSPQLKEAANKTRWNIVRGDRVQIISKNHPEKGKQGIVKAVLRDRDRVIVEGVNMANRHMKGDPDKGIPGRTVSMERSIHYSNVNLVDPVTGLPTRVARKFMEDGTKVRVSKRSGAVIPKPDILTMRKKPISSIVTDSDTLEDDVWEMTYVHPLEKRAAGGGGVGPKPSNTDEAKD
mmetsp:Transcript_4195/g.6335  ORF Transcript_4195/g.6335 Transcript_4195/m.6335 type:complete len:194 (-) Transcript_4195:1373-1954(-)